MSILIIRSQVTPAQLDEMLEELGIYIKLAVDVERCILAGGGRAHYDCEQTLLEDGSVQANIWGCDWTPIRRQITYESIINIRPRKNNSMEILDSTIRSQIERIIFNILGES
ncbi:DUF5674 family protein [Leptolyngbya sp. AN03gr2]|uniref:DUF5674 family protein n=1 Tax=unclassified Leptolyngbya TaxID=2650499 RepID=UPI003D31C5F1